MKMKTELWKVKGFINRCTPESSDKNKGEEILIPTYKIYLLQLVQTDKIFSKEIMRELLLKLKYLPRFLGTGITSVSSNN